MPDKDIIKFELLFIGNELLIGQVLNTNSQWLTRQITLLGGICSRITVIRDNLTEISRTIKEVLIRSPHFLIISGGLGPTYDDMTLEGVAKALNKPLKINKIALKWVTEKYQKYNIEDRVTDLERTPSRVKMATLPETAQPLPNPLGTAPGVLIQRGITKIICLPGVPKELVAIFNDSLRNLVIRDIGESQFVESHFKVKGIGESDMAPTIKEVMAKHQPYVYIKSHPKHGGSDVTVEFHLTTPENIQSYGKERGFLKHKIEDAQEDLVKGIKKLGGKIEY